MRSTDQIRSLAKKLTEDLELELEPLRDSEEFTEIQDPDKLLAFAIWWKDHFDPESDMLTTYHDFKGQQPKTRKTTTQGPLTKTTSPLMRSFLQGTKRPPE